MAVVTIGKVCDTLGLTGLSLEAAAIATDKMRMKEAYQAYGVRTAKYCKVFFQDGDLEERVGSLRMPIVVKAVDTSGSRGIVKVRTKEELADAVSLVRAHTQKNYFIAEEFLEGEEFGAQAFVNHGKLQFLLPHGDYVYQGDTGVPVGHWMPYAMQPQVFSDLQEQLQKAVEAMQLDHCAINADFILSDGKVFVLEIGGRAGATCLAEMVSLYFHYNYYEKMILAALGQDVDFGSSEANASAAMLLRSQKDGVIREIRNGNLPDDPDLAECQFDYGIGEAVCAFRVGPHRIGHVIARGATAQQACKKVEEAVGKIEIITG